MFKRIKSLILTSGMLLASLFPFLAVPATHVYAIDGSKQAACESLGSTSCTDDTGGPSVEGTVSAAISLLSFIAGIAAVIMIIVAGIRLITSQGDPNGLSNARNAIIYAAVGIVIVILSQVFVRFVINRATA